MPNWDEWAAEHAQLVERMAAVFPRTNAMSTEAGTWCGAQSVERGISEEEAAAVMAKYTAAMQAWMDVAHTFVGHVRKFMQFRDMEARSTGAETEVDT